MSHHYFDRPMAAEGLHSYRYKGAMGWIMIGSISDIGALKEAERSFSFPQKAKMENLQKWDGNEYVNVNPLPCVPE